MRANLPEKSAKKSVTVSPVKKTNILDLNDDCFREVFPHLSLTDLSAVKDTCRRFGPVADEQFHRKFRHFEYTFCPVFDEHPTGNEFDISSSVFNNFGHAMTKLIVRKLISGNVMEYWQEICETFTSLKELSVYDCDLSFFKPTQIHVQREALDSLQIIECSGTNLYFTRMVKFFGNVKRLKLRDSFRRMRDGGLRCTFLQNAYPSLTEISLEIVHADKHFREFVEKNPQLKKILLKNCTIGYDKLDCIANCCENIESISIEYYRWSENIYLGPNIASLSRLNKLKELQFRCGGLVSPALEMMAEKNLLETLGLSDACMGDRLCQAICYFTNLQTLKLTNTSIAQPYMLAVIVNVLKLKHLHIIRCRDIQPENVVDAIRGSDTLETVTFAHFRDWWTLDLPIFLELVEAGALSGAGFPLELSLQRSAIERGPMRTVDIQPYEEFIKLRVFDSFDEYLMRFG